MKKNKILIPLLVFVAFIGGAAWSYLVIKQLDHGTILTSGSGGNYTINENSISAAVDKVYDATVVVASIKEKHWYQQVQALYIKQMDRHLI